MRWGHLLGGVTTGACNVHVVSGDVTRQLPLRDGVVDVAEECEVAMSTKLRNCSTKLLFGKGALSRGGLRFFLSVLLQGIVWYLMETQPVENVFNKIRDGVKIKLVKKQN